METNFNDILWTQTQIIHNGEFHKKCIIGVPVYKEHLSLYEIASLAQLCKIIQNSYEICLIYPFELNISEYQYISEQFGVKLSTLECSKDYFKSKRTYSYLCETTQFYECFSEYKYLFVYQLDGWIFKNLLDYYIDLDVDYIGSPWKEGSYRFFFDAVGNGGVSLRRVQKFIEVCRRLKPSDFKRQYVEFEDLFFCKTLRAEMGFKFPTVKNAANFSLTLNWNYFIEKYTKGHLPMCLHAWYKEYNRFKKYINIEQYKDILDNTKNEKEINKDERESEEKMNYDEFVRQYYQVNKIEKNQQDIIDNREEITNYIQYICEQAIPFNVEQSEKERIIISLTSWKKRIQNVCHVLNIILNNTIKPDMIVINLAVDEFPNMMKDLPTNLIKLINSNENIKINWLKHNTKVWKKLIPTLYLYPNDLIIPIDDDFEYPNYFIETLYNDYVKYNKEYPISGNKITKYDMKCHCGCSSLLKSSFITKYINILNKEIFDAGSSDIFYTFCAYINGISYKQSSKEFFYNMKTYNANDPYSSNSSTTKIIKTYEACQKAYRNMLEIQKNILICIFNYKHDNNARILLNAFKPYFDTCVLDSGNDKINEDFIQYDNIYYSGLMNEAKKLSEKYKWVGIICSDVKITDDNIRKLISKLQWLYKTTNVGQYQPSFDINSYVWLRNIHTDKYIHESKIFLDGPCIFIRQDVLQELPFIDLSINKYGWGITRVTSYISMKNDLLNIFDNTILITHEANKSGYSNIQAGIQLSNYFKDLKDIAKKIEQLMKQARLNNSLGEANIKLKED